MNFEGGAVGFLLLIMSLFCLVLFGIVIPICKRHREATNGVVNYNADMTRFVYKVYAGKEEIIRLLQTDNIADEVTFRVNMNNGIMTVYEKEGVYQEYYYTILEYTAYSVLRLQKVKFIDRQSYIQLKLNPSIIRKLPSESIFTVWLLKGGRLTRSNQSIGDTLSAAALGRGRAPGKRHSAAFSARPGVAHGRLSGHTVA